MSCMQDRLTRSPKVGKPCFFPRLSGFGVLSLLKKLRKLRKQPVKVTSDGGPAADLLDMPNHDCPKCQDAWENTQRNPAMALRKFMGGKVPSCYGWRELEAASRN